MLMRHMLTRLKSRETDTKSRSGGPSGPRARRSDSTRMVVPLGRHTRTLDIRAPFWRAPAPTSHHGVQTSMFPIPYRCTPAKSPSLKNSFTRPGNFPNHPQPPPNKPLPFVPPNRTPLPPARRARLRPGNSTYPPLGYSGAAWHQSLGSVLSAFIRVHRRLNSLSPHLETRCPAPNWLCSVEKGTMATINQIRANR